MNESTIKAGAAAKILNVSTETLRTWADDGNLPFEIEKTDGGHRLYPEAHVHDLARRLAGKDPIQMLQAMQGMVLVPAEEQIGPGMTRIHHSNGDTGTFVQAGRWPPPCDMLVRDASWDEAKVPARAAPAPGLLAALGRQVANRAEAMLSRGGTLAAPAYDHDTGQLMVTASENPARPGEGLITIRVVVLEGPARGQVAIYKLPMNPSAIGPLRAWTGVHVSAQQQTIVTTSQLLELIETSLYRLDLTLTEPDTFDFLPSAIPHCITVHGVVSRRVMDMDLPLVCVADPGDSTDREAARANLVIDANDWDESSDEDDQPF